MYKIIAMTAALLAAGCASTIVQPAKVEAMQLATGKTSKDEVQGALGFPTQVQREGDKEVWIYLTKSERTSFLNPLVPVYSWDSPQDMQKKMTNYIQRSDVPALVFIFDKNGKLLSYAKNEGKKQ